MTTHPYSKELLIGSLAVQRAALLTKKLLSAVDKGHLDKSDDTPVTIADFAAQASIIAAIHKAFPSDSIIGEEDSTALRENAALFDRTWDLATSTHLDDPQSESHLHTPTTKEEMLDLIDLGAQPFPTDKTPHRVWTLDPVDGTATFINGQQYAVCLSLIENGKQVLGLLACPNLPDTTNVHEDNIDPGHGHLLTAVLGHGARIQPLGTGALLPSRNLSRIQQISTGNELRFVDTSFSPSGRLDVHAAVAGSLEAPWPASVDIWSAQMRYVAIAMGACNAFVKVPKKETYRSKIWDHSGGMLLVQELGCKVTDMAGGEVDCGRGRTLEGCYGMVVAPESVHGVVLEAVGKARAAKA
ncbi:3'(2')-5'-bisphosphate nucleotidase [Penicillium waksmanii]|uniref:3'(2')-5'-bisphosphate nucleotidase n=1 Tax=Penicillium waksmanii TaxID=69791 RepID=UPI002546BB79|nr:3'(2')-5'-bisphosphate nucleotidase [Penicillium waksmanii]KAJ5966428.1 3'(2')-5'-bisphosphate nucleotidase [Penicillium waksmanii]